MTTEPRIPMQDPELLEGRFGDLNVTRTIGQNPALLKAWGAFATYILGPDLSITARERELAILRVGFNHRADYEWGHHVVIAKSIGMSEEDIQAVQAGPGSSHLSELERAILQAVDDVYAGSKVTAETWEALKPHYNDQQMLDLLFTVGQYTLVCIALNSIGIELEEGFSGLPEV